jgi:type I restriction enzyme R subunit
MNGSRQSYFDEFEELIRAYNSGDIDAEKLFLELMQISRNLNAEENRHVRENLTEEELVIFDILTKPVPKLSKSEIEAVKQVAKELLEKLKKERLVLDWRKRQSTRAKVVNTIADVCDSLPNAYDSGHLQGELYMHVYDNYPSAEHRFAQ